MWLLPRLVQAMWNAAPSSWPQHSSGTCTQLLRKDLLDSGVVTTEAEAEQYATRSLRRGVATQLDLSGASRERVRKRGRWKSDRTADLYVDRDTLEQRRTR